MYPWNIPRVEDFFHRYGLEVITGISYLGGFVGVEVAQDRWLEDKVKGQWDSVDIMSGVLVKHPQTAYKSLQNSHQQE